MSRHDESETNERARRVRPSQRCSPERDVNDPLEPAPADREERDHDELEFDDPVIDEAALPALDTEDADIGLREPGFDDLLDRGWLERGADAEVDEQHSAVDDIGLTIELDGPADEDDGAQVVDLDVGSLLTSLPSDGTELDLEPGLMHERSDATLGMGMLRDMLLPEEDDEHDDREVGDDDRFPVFDEHPGRQPRSPDDESEIGPEDLS